MWSISLTLPTYRVFINYCVFFQEFSKVCHIHTYQPIGVTVHSHCVESFEGLLQRCRRGRGCSELWKNTIFPGHPVHCLFISFSRAASLTSNHVSRSNLQKVCVDRCQSVRSCDSSFVGLPLLDTCHIFQWQARNCRPYLLYRRFLWCNFPFCFILFFFISKILVKLICLFIYATIFSSPMSLRHI